MSGAATILFKLHEAYEELFGEAGHVIEFRKDAQDARVPTELDVLFFMAEPDEDDVTIVATAGMSSRTTGGAYERVEIAFEMKGGPDEESREKIAKQLAELATVPFRQGESIAPDTVIEGLRLYPFVKMNHALIVHWQVLSELFLPGTNPQVLLLRLIPLYESEAKLAEEIGAKQAFTRLQAKGVVFEDFERDPGA